MIKMSPFAVSICVLVVLSTANADVSHLHGQNQNQIHGGYHYANLGSTALHTPESPPLTQYQPSSLLSAVGQLPSSYVPPASGSPFESSAPLPATAPVAPTQRLSVPLQSPVFAAQIYQSNQVKYPQQSRSYLAPTYQNPSPAYQNPSPAYQTAQSQVSSSINDYTVSQGQVQQRQTQQQQQQQPPLVTKQFYVYAAPEDPEEQAGPRFVQVGRARKNYKVIFIKTPHFGLKSQIIPVVPPSEEKTIVYVLSKKPSFDQDIQLPEQPPTEPSKPDVYFIKYKTQEEANQAQQSIQAAYDQANLASADNTEQISAAFGGQDSTQLNYQQNQN